MLKFFPFFVLAVTTCIACGATFSASDGAGGSGVGTAGEAGGGLTNAAGQSQAAGADGSGAGRSGWGNGGRGSGSGGYWGGGSECAALRQEYQDAVEQARVCDQDSTDQCSPSSVIQPLGCGCPVFVNAKSEYTDIAEKAYKAFQDSRCDYGGIAACDIYCGPAASVTCGPLATSTGSSSVCTPSAIQK